MQRNKTVQNFLTQTLRTVKIKIHFSFTKTEKFQMIPEIWKIGIVYEKKISRKLAIPSM